MIPMIRYPVTMFVEKMLHNKEFKEAVKQELIRPNEMELELMRTDDLSYDEFASKIANAFDHSEIDPSHLGSMLDYLSRTEQMMRYGVNTRDALEEAFKISLRGAAIGDRNEMIYDRRWKHYTKNQESAQSRIKKLITLMNKTDRDYAQIMKQADHLVRYDATYRIGRYSHYYSTINVNPDEADAFRCMVQATNQYLSDNEEIVEFGLEFERNDNSIMYGDMDLLSTTSVIDFKCSKHEPKREDILQLICYYIIGMHERPDEFKNVKYLKIINPRLGRIYTVSIDEIERVLMYMMESKMNFKTSIFAK